MPPLHLQFFTSVQAFISSPEPRLSHFSAKGFGGAKVLAQSHPRVILLLGRKRCGHNVNGILVFFLLFVSPAIPNGYLEFSVTRRLVLSESTGFWLEAG